MYRKIIFGLISFASLCVFLWNAHSFYSSPVAGLVIDRQLEDIKDRINLELLRSANPEHLVPRIQSALEPTPADWTSIDLLREFAEEHEVKIPDHMLQTIKLREDKERGLRGAKNDCMECVLDSENCPSATAQMCNIALELTPIGDIRSLKTAVDNWQAERPIDMLDASLATVGIVSTAAAFFSSGATYSIKAGTGVIKAARSAGNIGKPLYRFIAKNTEGLIDFKRLPPNWHIQPSSIAKALDMKKYSQINALAKDIGGIQSNLGLLNTVQMLRFIDNGKDAHRAKVATNAMRDRTLQAAEVLGKKKLFKQTYRLNPKITRIIGASIGLATGLIGLFWAFFINIITSLTAKAGQRALKKFEAKTS